MISYEIFVFQFEKPGRREDFDYPDMAKEAVTKALKDAKIEYKEVKQAVVGFCYGKFLKFYRFEIYQSQDCKFDLKI